jgi:hypothetical protein
VVDKLGPVPAGHILAEEAFGQKGAKKYFLNIIFQANIFCSLFSV